jgi:glucose/arabinose dehydrogenase
MNLVRTLIGAVIAFASAGAAAVEHSEQHSFRVEAVADGLNQPWGLAFLPDGSLLVTEKAGRLLRIDPRSGRISGVEGVPAVAASGQGGLLDVALHPEFARTRMVYLSYSEPTDEGAVTAVGRGRLEQGRLNGFHVLFRGAPAVDTAHHFGSRLVFDGAGHLFITSGERGQRENVQELDNDHGKLVRLAVDGAIPEDNPFVDEGDALPGIYSYGHRNPQGMAQHPRTGDIWINEHGPRGGDELNIVRPGANYGWPEVTRGREYYGPGIGVPSRPDVVEPVYGWTPSIAPSGMHFYQGDAFPEWRGDLFLGSLAYTHLVRLELDGERVVAEERLLDDRGWRIRAVEAGPDGALYLLVDAEDTPLLRLVPVGGDS